MKSISLPNERLIPEIKRLIDEGHTATFRVRGFSMRPFLEDRRDKVLLSPCSEEEICVGDVVLAEIAPGCYVLHRVMYRQDTRIILRGDGNVKGTERCLVTDVIGKATGFYRKGRTRLDSVSSWKWKLYSALWPAFPFVRRLLLAFHRRVWLRLCPSVDNYNDC